MKGHYAVTYLQRNQKETIISNGRFQFLLGFIQGRLGYFNIGSLARVRVASLLAALHHEVQESRKTKPETH